MDSELNNNQSAEDEAKAVQLIEAILTGHAVRFTVEDIKKDFIVIPQEIENKEYLVFEDENGKVDRVLISTIEQLEVL